ncbi:MAG: ABC transporter permease, partial [Planctomycetes bacterium]|nr:ABC transporter permease [Planctomycetota bacterium]
AVNTWSAEDLGLAIGDSVNIQYYEVQDDNALIERKRDFVVSHIISIEGMAADRTLMPPFPGLSEKEDCREWDPGTEVDLDNIRDKDEVYWDNYKGTPKAFIHLADGRAMWQNRFGDATAYRVTASQQADIDSALRAALDPADFSLRSIALAQLADQAASKGSYYISSVFVSLNGFLIIAVCILISLCTSLSLARRRRDVGIMLSIGYTPKKIRRMFVAEMSLLTILASVGGVLLAYVYHVFLIHLLHDAWSDAIAGVQILAQINVKTILIGVISVLLIVLGITVYHVRHMCASAALQLLQGPQFTSQAQGLRQWLPAMCFTLSAASAVVLLLLDLGTQWMAPQFFMAAACVLASGFAAAWWYLAYVSQNKHFTFFSMWVSGNLARKPLRSMLLLIMLSSCVFLVVASSAFHMQGDDQLLGRKSASGGFAYFAKSSLAIERDIHSPEGQKRYHIDQQDLLGHVVLMRSNNDNESSCLNLNQNVNPRIWGVDWQYFDQQSAFTFAQSSNGSNPWQALGQRTESGRIPIIGDINYLMWTMGKTVGAVMTYPLPDGSEVELEVCGLVQDSILQGALIMDEKFFVELFPQRPGYNYMLVDVAEKDAAQFLKTLQHVFFDNGLVFESSSERFMRYVRVRNMYLLIFQIMGALGLLLASLGLSVVVLRHIEERRYEWSVARAIGYHPQRLLRALSIEHALVFFVAVSLGCLSAYCAIQPVLAVTGHALSPILIWLLIAVLATGFAAIFYAVRMQRVRSLADALRRD